MSVDEKTLQRLAQELPIIRPIKEFIHLNLLLPYQHLPFWQAIEEVSSKLEAYPFLGPLEYRQRMEQGAFRQDEVKARLAELLSDQELDRAINFLNGAETNFIHHDVRMAYMHESWNELVGINIIQLADGMLIRWLSHYLDQGIAHWPMPGADYKGFYQCLRDLFLSSRFKVEPFTSSMVDELWLPSSSESLRTHLAYLCPDEELQENYVREALLTLRGWAGLVHNLESQPQLIPFRRRITLEEFLAVKFILERAWISTELKQPHKPLFRSSRLLRPFGNERRFEFQVLRACQESWEQATYRELCLKMSRQEERASAEISFQVLFCMDDREGSLRRYLEEASDKIETFGTAGHFGIECLYRHPEDAFSKKQCPAPLAPRVVIEDHWIDGESRSMRELNVSSEDIQPTGSIIVDWISTHLKSVSSTLKLLRNVFFPLQGMELGTVQEEISLTRLNVLHQGEHDSATGLPLGYTVEQMVEIVYRQLTLIGHVKHFAPLMMVIGHQSTSENNPYYATYGCGACSGRSGAANARSFCWMANHPEVRERLSSMGLVIPSATYFVAGVHDTTQDVVKFFDANNIPAPLQPSFQKFKKYLSLALYKNALERTQAFKRVTFKPISKDAHREVLRRSLSFFETRPELGHTNVAFAIVARRGLSKGLSPGYPAFLQSYDPAVDPEGLSLAALLSAVIPVCSGINLDYYFSRMDNLRFGAGSKLPQNVIGNFGVSHGTESDLLFGLPQQMIDQHNPLRLLVLVEQTPAIALRAVQDNLLVRQIVYNNWIQYMCYDDEAKIFYQFRDGVMLPFQIREGR